MQTLSLARVLQSCGHSVCTLCYFEFDNQMVAEFHASGSHVVLLNLGRRNRSLRILRLLKEQIGAINPDIMHVQYMAPGAIPIVAGRLAGVKHIFATVHQPYTTSHGCLAKLILRIASLFTTKFIAVSQSAELSWFGSSHLFDESITSRRQHCHYTIHNSVDTGLIQRTIEKNDLKDLKQKLSIPEEMPVIGAISRLRHEKGIDILIEAFNKFEGEGAKAHLLLVGSGPDENLLKKKVEDYDLGTKVTFSGEADWEGAMQLMAIMDIVVVPSRFEGFGLTAAEAMAAGKPVVASDSTGLKEVIIDGETGILFPVEDSNALLLVLQKLIMDRDLRICLGSAGRKRINEHFSLEIFAEKIEALYRYYRPSSSL